MRSCPACRRSWPDDREVCPECLAHLVDDLDATATCSQCGHVCPARMQSCPSCFAILRASDIDLTHAYAHALATGSPMQRPPGRPPFAEAPGWCTVQRLVPSGPLVLVGLDGFVEATVEGSAPTVALPLTCVADDAVLFRVRAYDAADQALVAVGVDGEAIATFLRAGAAIDVRDETSAPVAQVQRVPGGVGWELVETGSRRRLAKVDRFVNERERWVDDDWTVTPTELGRAGTPLGTLALAALVVAVKVLLGDASASRVPDPEPPEDWARLR